MLKAIPIPLHSPSPITIELTLKGTRQGIHTQGDTQAIVHFIVVKMVGTQAIVVDNVKCVGKLDIEPWIVGHTLINIPATSVMHVNNGASPYSAFDPN